MASDEGERAPLYQPPPKREVQIEEPVREDGERKSAGTLNAKKRKSLAGLSSNGDGLSSKPARSISATSRVSCNTLGKTLFLLCIFKLM